MYIDQNITFYPEIYMITVLVKIVLRRRWKIGYNLKSFST